LRLLNSQADGCYSSSAAFIPQTKGGWQGIEEPAQPQMQRGTVGSPADASAAALPEAQIYIGEMGTPQNWLRPFRSLLAPRYDDAVAWRGLTEHAAEPNAASLKAAHRWQFAALKGRLQSIL
jgi:hypothetical protein